LKFTAAHHYTRCAETQCQAADTWQDTPCQQARPSIFTNTHACQRDQPTTPYALSCSGPQSCGQCGDPTTSYALLCAAGLRSCGQLHNSMPMWPASFVVHRTRCLLQGMNSIMYYTVARPIAQQHSTHQRQRVIIFQRRYVVHLLARWQVYQS
jgi:hypothetical protein